MAETKTVRYSRQRERILELVKSTDTHPSADWVYEILKKEIPGLSLGTVYRNLKNLAEQGLLSRVDFSKDYDRFDPNTDEHYHFVCEKCGKIIDLPVEVKHDLQKEMQKDIPFTVHRHSIQFYGVCDLCAKA